MNGRRTHGLEMMLMALGILILPGLMVNNLQNNGLISQNQAMTCANGTCVLSSNVGCQFNQANCGFQGNSIQFFNLCSPFTNILTLNLAGFIASFFTSCTVVNGQPTTITSPQTLLSFATTAGGLTVNVGLNYTFTSLVNPSRSSNIFSLNSVSPQLAGVTLNSTTFATFVCANWNLVPGNVTAGTIPTLTPCSITVQNPRYGVIFGVAASCWLYGDTSNGFITTPKVNGPSVNKAICTNFGTLPNTVQCSNPPCNGGLANLSLFNGNIIGFFLTLIGAALVILIGLGVNVSAATLGIGSNPQGSKFAQTLGVGLMIWFPLFTEFNTWFSNGYFPAGFDTQGSPIGIGIIATALIATFFMGLWMVSQSGSAASQ